MAASKRPPYSPLPLIAPDGTMSEPLSGRFSVICRPGEGGEGILLAIRDCEEGGSILLREGFYRMTRRLILNRRVNIIGRGRAELRGEAPQYSYMIWSTSPSAILDRLRSSNQSKGHS